MRTRKNSHIRKKECSFNLGSVPEFKIPEISISFNRRTGKIWNTKILSATNVAELLKKIFPKKELEVQEQVIVLYLNSASHVIGYYRHSRGGINQSIIDVRLILSLALKSLSTGIILAHNHPSGNLTPSINDRKITQKLKESAAIMDITLYDHLIITKDGFYSFENDQKSLGRVTQEKITKEKNIVCGDVLTELKKLPKESVDCVITSPPYWQLRDYGFSKQWGLEKTFKEYLSNLWLMMDEIHRVLKPQGTVWINLGDTYFGSGNGSGQTNFTSNMRGRKAAMIAPRIANDDVSNKLQKKCQVLIPHRFAIGCIDRGWIVRNDIIWAKPNGLPESTHDRFSKKHEYIFLLVKQANYFFDLDAVREAHKENSVSRLKYKMTAFGGDAKNKKGAFGKGAKNGGKVKSIKLNPAGKNPGDVSDFWNISTKRGSGKHYATFNTDLITKPILAGCPEGGVILDPFCGTGTTGIKAIELGRKFIGIDAKKEYCLIAAQNIQQAVRQKPAELKMLVRELENLSFEKAA